MTTEELEKVRNTPWGIDLVYVGLFTPAIERLKESNFKVYIHPSTDTGEKRWAIVCEKDYSDFWLDSFSKKKDAITLCKEMDWRIVK
jgi:hypothetical protein